MVGFGVAVEVGVEVVVEVGFVFVVEVVVEAAVVEVVLWVAVEAAVVEVEVGFVFGVVVWVAVVVEVRFVVGVEMSVDHNPTCPDCGDDLIYLPDEYIPQVLGWRYYWGKPEGTVGDWTCPNCPEKKWFDIPEWPLPEPEGE